MRIRLLAAAVAVLAVSACSPGGTGDPSDPGAIVAVGAENQYADVISQVGGKYVSATAIMSNPNTDPHTFEASPQVARELSSAQIVVQNGVGYDSFMNTILDAAPAASREVINVQPLLSLPDSTQNPRLWYKPGTMAAVANAVAGDLARIQPAHAAYFKANAATFINSLST